MLEERVLLAADPSADLYQYETDILARNAAGVWQVSSVSGQTPTLTDRPFGAWNPNIAWADVRAGDFDGDGLDDVVGRDPATGYLWVSLSDGVGSTTRLAGQWSTATTWSDVTVTDLPGAWDLPGTDPFAHKEDLIGRAADGSWWAAIAVGDGTFVNTQIGKWSPNAGWQDVTVMDVNGDDVPDIVGRAADGTWWATESRGGPTYDNVRVGWWNPAADWRDVTLVQNFFMDGKPALLGRASDGAWWGLVFSGGAAGTRQAGWWNPDGNWHDVMANGRTLLGRTDTGQWWAGAWGLLPGGNGEGMVSYYRGSINEAAGWQDFRYVTGTPQYQYSADGPFAVTWLIGRVSTGEWYTVNLGSYFPTTYRQIGYLSPADGWRDVRYADNVSVPPVRVIEKNEPWPDGTFPGGPNPVGTYVEIRGNRSGTVVTVENADPAATGPGAVKITYYVPSTGCTESRVVQLSPPNATSQKPRIEFIGHLGRDEFRNRSFQPTIARGWDGDDLLDGQGNRARDVLIGGGGIDTILSDSLDLVSQGF